MTLKHWLITGALAVAAIPAGAELYRWVDASGTVHYSDTPQAGAEKIELRPTNVIQGRRQAPTSRSQSGEQNSNVDLSELLPPLPYTAARIVSPQADETLWNLGGTLVVQIRIEPSLQSEHGVVLFYDGRPVNTEAVASTSVTINNVYRGQHSLRAAIKDEEGNTVFNGDTISFFVQQSSVN